MMTLRPSASAAIVLCALATVAWGEPPSHDAVAAEALFQEGLVAFKRGDFALACPRFAESYRLDPAPGALFDLADCEEHAGHLATAWQRWQELADVLRTRRSDERYGLARRHAAALLPRLARLRVRWAGEPVPGAVVKRDGSELGAASFDMALPADAGTHRIEVTAPGRQPSVYPVTTRDGTTSELAISVGEALASATSPPVFVPPPRVEEPPRPPPAPPAPRGQGRSLTIAGAVTLAVGLASLAIAAGTGAGAINEKNVVLTHCPDADPCDSQGLAAAERGHTMATVSTVTTVLGTIATAAGIVLLVVGRTRPERQARLVPVLGVDGAGLVLTGRF